MGTVIIKSEQLNLPEEMAKKLKGKEVELIETQEGILLRPLGDPVKDAGGSLKGSSFSYEKYMRLKKERYVVDEKGNRMGVLLDLEDYRKLLEALEELESIRAYDDAKASGDEAIPFEQAVAEIERTSS